MNGSANSKSDTVKFWRRRMLSLLARCYLGLAMIAALAGISVAIINDGWAIVVFDGVALLVGVGLVLCPDRFYGFKAAALITLTFVVGIFFIQTASLGIFNPENAVLGGSLVLSRWVLRLF